MAPTSTSTTFSMVTTIATNDPNVRDDWLTVGPANRLQGTSAGRVVSARLLGAELCRLHKLASADAIVYDTAKIHDADVLTCDARFERWPGVLYTAKTRSGA